MLLEIGDFDGASSRAYFAMFDAARAALLSINVETKTHNGVLTMFALHLVKTGLVSIELGRALKQAESYRVQADYEINALTQADAALAVGSAQTFVESIIAQGFE